MPSYRETLCGGGEEFFHCFQWELVGHFSTRMLFRRWIILPKAVGFRSQPVGCSQLVDGLRCMAVGS